jgi:hypothetical protein
MSTEFSDKLVPIKQRAFAFACLFFYLAIRVQPYFPAAPLPQSNWLKYAGVLFTVVSAVCGLVFIYVSKHLRLKYDGWFPKDAYQIGIRHWIPVVGIIAIFELLAFIWRAVQ